jgi:hypothetical protein
MAARLQHIPGMLLHRPLAICLYLTAGCFGLFFHPFLQSPDDESSRCAALSSAGSPAPAEATSESPRAAACPLGSPAVNVVDVAASAATPALVSQLIRLGADERVTAVDDQPAANDLAAGALIAARFLGLPPPTVGAPLVLPRGPLHRGDYIDITVQSEPEACSRRILVLFH